ncbi:hypothetical protein CI610_01999 [invertebrate metagenome]|uniref:Methyltransferase type 11 domain-containing protein n=1 Tax=invertebrate metagenome TaxID=1711999 RepID=A0A2H9T728_9ZZZZ
MAGYNQQKVNSRQRFENFDNWLTSRIGQVWLNTEIECLNPVLESIFGIFSGVCTGGSGSALLEKSLIHYPFFVSPYTINHSAVNQMVCDLCCWPVESQSLDLVVLHHTLELVTRPHFLLREATRTVSPEGKLVIIGVNPWSLYYCLQYMLVKQYRLWDRIPAISARRLTDWLTLLGYRIENICYGAHGFPFQDMFFKKIFKKKSQHGLSGYFRYDFSRLPVGAFYIIIASREESGMIPLKSCWRPIRKRFKRPTVIGPTTG